MDVAAMSRIAGLQEREQERQQVVSDYQLGRLSADPEFDAVSELSADLFDVPISAVTILAREQQFLPGVFGAELRSTPRGDALCNVTVARDAITIIEDVAADPNFQDHPLVAGPPHIRFYAGAPIRLRGVAVGSLCIIDQRPRRLDERDRRRLTLLAQTVVNLMELKLAAETASRR